MQIDVPTNLLLWGALVAGHHGELGLVIVLELLAITTVTWTPKGA